MSETADLVASRVAAHVHPGDVVNLGIGIPTAVADHLGEHPGVVLQTENGMLGVGHAPSPGVADPDLVNAGKQPVTATLGAAYFPSAESFVMIRGGHVDVAVLGALEVDEHGRIANWAVPGEPVLGVGGAMDLLVGARRVIVATRHLTKDGTPKIVPISRYPLSGDRPVSLVVTDHATFEVDDAGLVLVEIAEHSSLAWVRSHTTTSFRIRLEET